MTDRPSDEDPDPGPLDGYVPIAPLAGAAVGWIVGSFWHGLGVTAIVSLALGWIDLRARRRARSGGAA